MFLMGENKYSLQFLILLASDILDLLKKEEKPYKSFTGARVLIPALHATVLDLWVTWQHEVLIPFHPTSEGGLKMI